MKLRTILVAVHQTPAGIRALHTAARLAASAGARLVVLTVTEDQAPSPDQVEQRLSALIAGVLPANRTTWEAVPGAPGVEIPRVAEQVGASVIVLGRASPPAGQRPVLGRVIAGAVRRARVPCLVIPLVQPEIRQALAALDGGSASLVLDAAFAVARPLQAKVVALHVERPGSWERSEWDDARRAAMEGRGGPQLLVEAAPVAGYGTLVRRGEPVSEILNTVSEERIDLLVLGYCRGQGLGGGEPGCIASRLLARAPCATLTVPV